MFYISTKQKSRIILLFKFNEIQCRSAGKSNLKKTCVKRLEGVKYFHILKSRKYHLK